MSESESSEKKLEVSKEFKETVMKYIEIDDKLKKIREKTKELTAEKKSKEDSILQFIQANDDKPLNLPDGKLKRTVTKSQAPLKKDLIQKVLAEILGDANKATQFADQIDKSRPVTEKVALKRMQNRIAKE